MASFPWQVESLFTLLVQEPTPKDLSDGLQNLTINEKLAAAMVGLPHNMVLSNVESFVTAIGLEVVPVTSIKQVDVPGCLNQPVAPTILFFRMSCLMRDIAMVGAALHQQLLVELSEGKAVKKDKLVTTIPYLLSSMGEKQADLENVAVSTGAAEMEAEGWQLPTALSVIRLWQASMASFRGKCLALILEEWARQLQTRTNLTKAACQYHRACLKDSIWNEELASTMFAGKGPMIQKAHNALFDLLSSFNQAAKIMDVPPRLQAHPLTKDTIAMSLHTLGEARMSYVVATVVQVLVTYKDHHLGPQKCREFLQAYPPRHIRGDPEGVPLVVRGGCRRSAFYTWRPLLAVQYLRRGPQSTLLSKGSSSSLQTRQPMCQRHLPRRRPKRLSGDPPAPSRGVGGDR